MHIKPLYIYALLCCFTLFFPACGGDDREFEEVSRLISSRNSARYKKAEKKKKPVKVESKGQKPSTKPAQTQTKNKTGKKKSSSEALYEEKILIVSSSSKTTLGVGTAYLNKDGEIIQIKIKRD